MHILRLPFWSLHRAQVQRTALWLVGAIALLAHICWPGDVPLPLVLALIGGMVLGALLGGGGAEAGRKSGRDARNNAVVMQDVLTLRQAFGVLRQQVDATIHSSETAVLSMMERMSRVHRNAHELRVHVLEAVGRSQSLSSDSLSRAGQHGQAVQSLAQHQAVFEAGQVAHQGRVRAPKAQASKW
jgi:methyl-accepting chemotaxis protein